MDIRRAGAARWLTVLFLAVGVVVLPAAASNAARPSTTITAGPAGLVDSRTATFRFKSVAGATFQCRMDAAASWSRCTSPKEYRKLSQGEHTFRVRAVKNGQADRTPASRVFTVDTVAPETTISDGPTGTSQVRTPTFTFGANESASFVCRLDGVVVDPCSSPFSPAGPLTDNAYNFRVTATDIAGNVDATPATRAFAVDTPLTMDLATAQQAAALYLPDTIDMDVPARCGDNGVDCEGGTPAPAADQLRATSTRVVTLAEAQSDPINLKYLVTLTSSVSTLPGQSIKVANPFGDTCDLALTSASGAVPTWEVLVPLQFYFDPRTGERKLQIGTPTVNGLEAADAVYTGNFACTLVAFPVGIAHDVYTSSLLAHFDAVGWPLCAVPGPDYLGPCA